MINLYGVEDKYSSICTKVYKALLEHFNMIDNLSIDISLVDTEQIKQLNLDTRGIDKITDVLSYPNIDDIIMPLDIGVYNMDIDQDSGRLMLGEIIICEEVMINQAEEYGHSLEREMAYLTVHGYLHLLGFDHMIEEDKLVMRKHEEEILMSIGINR